MCAFPINLTPSLPPCLSTFHFLGKRNIFLTPQSSLFMSSTRRDLVCVSSLWVPRSLQTLVHGVHSVPLNQWCLQAVNYDSSPSGVVTFGAVFLWFSVDNSRWQMNGKASDLWPNERSPPQTCARGGVGPEHGEVELDSRRRVIPHLHPPPLPPALSLRCCREQCRATAHQR